MKFKQSLLLILSMSAMLLSANSYAGRQGINYYYGVGLGAAAPADSDVTATGNLMIGLEEDGWSLEIIGFGSIESGTDITTLDYSISGTDIGLAYRSIEKNGRYYKIKFSNTDLDIDFKNTVLNTTTTVETSGNSYTFGMAWRTSRENRVELDYTYHNNDDLSDPVHMVTLSYLWGGAPYLGKQF